jgi:flagellar FliL protein
MAKGPKKIEGETAGDDDAPAKARRRFGLGFFRRKAVLAGAVLLLLAGGGGFGAMKMGLLGKHGGAEAEEAKAAEGRVKSSVSFVDLPEMTVNLDAGDRAQYLKVKIALEVAEQKLAQDIQPMMPRVLDTFQTYMRELRPADLEGSAGLFRLKEELTKRVNMAVYPAKVDAVLFKEIVVQ